MKSVENYVNGLIAYGTFYGDQRDSISPEINRIKTIVTYLIFSMTCTAFTRRLKFARNKTKTILK